MPILTAAAILELVKLGLTGWVETMRFLQTPEGQAGLRNNRENWSTFLKGAQAGAERAERLVEALAGKLANGQPAQPKQMDLVR